MTRFLGERDFGKALAAEHEGIQSLAKRPAPAPVAAGGATSAAMLRSFSYATAPDDNVVADTWELVTPGAGTRYFTESWRTTGGGFGVYYDGPDSFLHADFAHYVAYATVTFWAATNNDILGAAIQYAASSTHFYPNTVTVKGGVAKVTVSAPWWGTLDNIRLYCYHSAGGEINAATFIVRKFELNSSGTVENR